MMTSKVAITGKVTKVELAGDINEQSDFSEILAQVVGDVVVDMDGVVRTNSSGLLRWLKFVHRVNDAGGIITLERCRTHFVDQLNMVYQLTGNLGRVASFYAPYACDGCDRESEELVRSEEVRAGQAPERKCPECAKPMELDTSGDSYFHFLSSETNAHLELNLDCEISTADTSAVAILQHFTINGAIATVPEGFCKRGDSVIAEIVDKKGDSVALRAVVGYASAPYKACSRVELTWDKATEQALQRFQSVVHTNESNPERGLTMSVVARSEAHRESLLGELAKGDLTVQCSDMLPLDAATTVVIITESGNNSPRVEEIEASTVSISRSKDGRVFVGLRARP